MGSLTVNAPSASVTCAEIAYVPIDSLLRTTTAVVSLLLDGTNNGSTSSGANASLAVVPLMSRYV
jgi:hypothetical protein